MDLDKPLADYASVPFDHGGATVRQVLNMRSGFPQDPLEATLTAVAEDLDRHWDAEDVTDLVVEGTRLGSQGGDQEYNNLNFLLLGTMIEKVTGEPLAEVLWHDLLGPAGLDRVW